MRKVLVRNITMSHDPAMTGPQLRGGLGKRLSSFPPRPSSVCGYLMYKKKVASFARLKRDSWNSNTPPQPFYDFFCNYPIF